VFAALDDVQYRGPLNIESFTAHNASIATAAAVWRPLAPSQDQLAEDGLAFLRRTDPSQSRAALALQGDTP
jgi:D-psicose/D-tagatose/L-ribulose 3-epimerase